MEQIADHLTEEDGEITISEAKRAKFYLNDAGIIAEKTKETYHQQRLKQSNWAFRLSLVASAIGFAVILWSIYQGYAKANTQWPGLVSGAVIEAVSALFYNMSNKANEKIMEFFLELSKDANVNNAIQLTDQIEDKKKRDDIKSKLSLHLAGICGEDENMQVKQEKQEKQEE